MSISITLTLPQIRFVSLLVAGWLAFTSAGLAEPADEGEPFHSGPLFDKFELTLAPGQRTEIAGPLFYQDHRESMDTWAIPPLFSHAKDSATDSEEFDFLYPVLTYDRYGAQYRLQFLQVLSWAGGPSQDEEVRNRFTLFPIYFQQRSSKPEENYTAFLPFYGHLKHRLFRDEIFVVLFPLYSQTRKADVVTDNYLVPLFHLRHGQGLSGWQFWPFVGNEHKNVTTRTNGFGDIQTIGGHDDFFALWPLYFNERSGLGTDNPNHPEGLLPFYAMQRSPKRDSDTIIWPFFSRVDDRDQKYLEWDAPWPFIVFAHGEGKTTHRVFPFYSHAQGPSLSSDFILWPIYKRGRTKSPPLDRDRIRILFYLYSDLTEKNTETGKQRQRRDLCPLFTWRKDYDGSRRLQVLAPLEPFVPGSHKIDRDWSPVWSLWRAEFNARTGASSQSLLWNLYRHQTTPAARNVSLLFGLFQYQSDSTGNRVRLFYIPIGPGKAPEFSEPLP